MCKAKKYQPHPRSMLGVFNIVLKLKFPQVSDWSANEDFAQRHVIFDGVTPLLNSIEKAFFQFNL